MSKTNNHKLFNIMPQIKAYVEENELAHRFPIRGGVLLFCYKWTKEQIIKFDNYYREVCKQNYSNE